MQIDVATVLNALVREAGLILGLHPANERRRYFVL